MSYAAGLLAAGQQADQLQQGLTCQGVGLGHTALLPDPSGVQGGGLGPSPGPPPESLSHWLCRC